MVSANRDFVSKYPIATKRALRAFQQATDICATQPQRAAQYMVDKGFSPGYDIGLEVVKDVPYQLWRHTNPEDTMRFHALRLHEVGMVTTSPEKLISQGANWHFLNELRKELKA